MKERRILIVGRTFSDERLLNEYQTYNEIHTLYAIRHDIPPLVRKKITKLAAFHTHERDEIARLRDKDESPFLEYAPHLEILTWESIEHLRTLNRLTHVKEVLTSSLACLLYAIIKEGNTIPTSITIRGFPLYSEGEYSHQREAVSYYVGLLEGMLTRVRGFELDYEEAGIYGKDLPL